MEESQNVLTEIFNKSNDNTVKGAAETAINYTNAFNNGVIGKGEYIKLMSFIVDTNHINRNIKNIKAMDDMNKSILNLMDMAQNK
jgi:phosphoribosyl 1,2-cyclic phosphodiesterase